MISQLLHWEHWECSIWKYSGLEIGRIIPQDAIPLER